MLGPVVCVIQHHKHKVWIYFCFVTLLYGAAVHPKSKFHPFPTHTVLKELQIGKIETTEAHNGHVLKHMYTPPPPVW